jgi:hypothetical protein
MPTICGGLGMPRSRTYPHKKIIGFKKRMIAEVDEWRRSQLTAPSRNAAIRALVEIGLMASRRATATQHQ